MDQTRYTPIYHSRDRQFKSPTGPVQTDTLMDFNILLAPEATNADLRLIIINDKTGEKTVHPMMLRYKEDLTTSGFLNYTCSVKIPDKGLYWYYFACRCGADSFYIGKNPDNNRAVLTAEHPVAWQQTVYKRSYQAPSWLYGGVIYHIFVDRFFHVGEDVKLPGKILRDDWGGMPHYLPDENGIIQNNDFFGGNLAGITAKLPYLRDLGIDCLYLSPIFEAYSSHKYDTGDYHTIDPMFGTQEDFDNLCKKAEESGIRIILDGVFSHTGDRSIYFNKDGSYDSLGAYQSVDSPYRDWYYFREDGSYESWWGIDTLPRINKENPDYMEFVNGKDGVIPSWLRKGAAGWRLDVVDELPNEFMNSLVAAAKKEKEDAIIIGEVWEDASNKIAYDRRKDYLTGDQLDSVMNYPLREAIIRFVRNGSSTVLRETVESILENYPPEVVHCLMNMLGNHDTPRILTALGGRELPDTADREEKAQTHMNSGELERAVNRLKMAVVLQMTLPGVPCIYYGDEAGMEGYADPFNRKCYPWGQERFDIMDWFKKIIAIRKKYPAFKEGDYRTVQSGRGIFVFERTDGKDRFLIAANASRNSALIYSGRHWESLISNRKTIGNFTLFPREVLLMKEVTLQGGGSDEL